MEQKDKELLVELIKLVQEGMGIMPSDYEDEVMWHRKATTLLNKVREVMKDDG